MSKIEAVRQFQADQDKPRWLVVETNFHQERLAKYHLERKQFEPYLPLRHSLSKRRDAARTTPLFPNYLFIPAMTKDDGRWPELFAAIGVRSILRDGPNPAYAPPGLVERIKAAEVLGVVQLQPKVVKTPHKKGDRVKVKSGAFEAYEGVFEEAIDTKRVLILLSFFGRQTPLEIEPEQLAAAY